MDKDLITQLQQRKLLEQQKLIGMLKKNHDEKDKLIDGKDKVLVEQDKLMVIPEARITTLENNQKVNSFNSSKPPIAIQVSQCRIKSCV